MTKGITIQQINVGKGPKAPALIKNLISTTITFDPPSLTTVTGAVSSGITITGAKLGDAVRLFPPYDTQGIIFQGYVTGTDTIKISLFNPTGSTIDLASGTWGVKVVRP